MADSILDSAKDKMEDMEEGLKDKGAEYKDKLYQVAEEHGLDPEHVEDWPEEAKNKLKT
jgi:hypothetical protein